MVRINNFNDLERIRKNILEKRVLEKITITICNGTGCQAYGCQRLTEHFLAKINQNGLKEKVEIRKTGCHGFCERGPIVVIQPEGIFYQRVKIEDIDEIIEKTVEHKMVIDRLLYEEPITGKKIIKEKEVPFYKKQLRIVFGKNGLIDPTSIEDYIAIGGYEALLKVLRDMKAEEVIDEIKRSGLRGRGGAGFLTGLKWEITRKNISSNPSLGGYIVCNCDEGDPGAYMDRSLLEGNPHLVIEGMAIGAYAIGVNKGFIYVRNEYPLAVKNASIAIDQAREVGLLGEDIMGSGFNFDLTIVRGAGAFVSGEETALIASIEGRRASPRPRPPYPAEQGLWAKPTNINNVETWANVPIIISNGSDWYKNIGTETSKGTKIFSLVGKINNTGLVEVPMGITLREIIFDIGGGIPRGKKFKAVQTGGPSGGCIPKEFLDLPVDFEKLTEVGSMMGSGGMIVMDEDTCMVDVARYFLHFTQEESCGKCVPCRIGIRQMEKILREITEGKGTLKDLQTLETLAYTVKNGSLCGLGQTAPNPVLTTLQYFREEYEAHIKEKRCPALVCKGLINYFIEPEKCVGCLLCLKNCPSEAILGGYKMIHVIVQEKCLKCGACLEVCPKKVSAVVKISGEKREGPKEPILVDEWRRKR
ncbi:MAG: NADH-quinone oxidoreductase subunit NuoF [Candidatus Aminicenantes bacterium]|nr:NADH-quinone oxidoreductase subunit NuoF [Candidatus Aminicenantes bacterium]